MHKRINFKILIILSLLLIPITFSYADIGPKPRAKITVNYNGKPIVGSFQTKMLVCERPEDNVSIDSDPRIRKLPIVSLTDNTSDINKILIKNTIDSCYW